MSTSNINWNSGNPSTSLTSKLSLQISGPVITQGVSRSHAEFPVGVDSFDGNWIAFLTDLRIFANNAGQDFSFYLSPKYLSPVPLYDRCAKLKRRCQYFGTIEDAAKPSPLSGLHWTTGTSVTGQTLIDAATAMKNQKNHSAMDPRYQPNHHKLRRGNDLGPCRQPPGGVRPTTVLLFTNIPPQVGGDAAEAHQLTRTATTIDVSKIYGKIQIVKSFPDYKVQVVDSVSLI